MRARVLILSLFVALSASAEEAGTASQTTGTGSQATSIKIGPTIAVLSGGLGYGTAGAVTFPVGTAGVHLGIEAGYYKWMETSENWPRGSVFTSLPILVTWTYKFTAKRLHPYFGLAAGVSFVKGTLGPNRDLNVPQTKPWVTALIRPGLELAVDSAFSFFLETKAGMLGSSAFVFLPQMGMGINL